MANHLDAEDKKILKKAYRISLTAGMSANQIVSFGRNYAMMMKAGRDVWMKDKPEEIHKDFVQEAGEYYNTNLTMLGLIGGITLGMEKERCHNGDNVDIGTISSIKTSLMGPLAGIGDSVIFNCFRVILAGVAISLATNGSIVGPLFFLITYGGGLLLLRWYLMKTGYRYGSSLISKAFGGGLIQQITSAASTLGSIMIGALVASNVAVKLKFAPDILGVTVDFQSILDSIMPGILSLVLWAVCTKVMKKGLSPIKLIFLIILICLVLSFFGIL